MTHVEYITPIVKLGLRLQYLSDVYSNTYILAKANIAIAGAEVVGTVAERQTKKKWKRWKSNIYKLSTSYWLYKQSKWYPSR